MYFSRVTLDPAAMNQRQLVSLALTDAYREHQQMWKLFGDDPDASRDFLYRREPGQEWPRYLLLSERQPQQGDTPWRIESKPFDPVLHTGMTLGFSLRCNPVVTRTVDGKKSRCDVVMDAKKQMGYQSMPAYERPPLHELVQQASLAWLQARSERCGFSFEPGEIRADGYMQHRFTGRGRRRIRLSTVDLAGVITVSDPARLKQALLQGIGPAKAFGCGLLLVRKV
jgi:CRISPR system Cascade subunit CasE